MQRPEQLIHQAVIAHLKARGVPGLVYFHCPTGAHYSGKRQGQIMKSLGVRAGVSDLILFHNSRFYCLELKAEGGRASEAQLAFLSEADAAGAYTAMPEGLNAALATLEAWDLVKGIVT
jgi:hypothetical protein